jgi:membrane protein
MKPRQVFELIKETFNEWSKDGAQTMGAALAYYAVFSIAPMLIIAIGICAAIFGEKAAQGHVADELATTVGRTAAEMIQSMIKNTSREGRGPMATSVGLVTLLVGALGVFGQLEDSLNRIWKVQPLPGRGWLMMLKDRLLSFAMLLVVGFLLMVSLAASTALQFLQNFSSEFISVDNLPGGFSVWKAANVVVSLVIITVLFAAIFKILPDVRLRWRDVGVGAIVTAVLFTIGKYVLGIYLGVATVASAYGAAGSLVVLLIWVYYSSQIVLFGAEFTRVYVLKKGVQVLPARHAAFIYCDERGQTLNASPHQPQTAPAAPSASNRS